MPDDAAPPPSRRTPPMGPRSAGLRAVPPPPLAPVIRLSPRTGRSSPRPSGPFTVPVLVVLPDVGTIVGSDAAAGAVADDDIVLSIQDRIRLRALEATAPQRGRSLR